MQFGHPDFLLSYGDVLTQLSFTLLVAFPIFQWSIRNQILLSFGLLILTEVLYRFTGIPGFDQPFTDQHNFGNYMDLVLMDKVNGDGWVAINQLHFDDCTHHLGCRGWKATLI